MSTSPPGLQDLLERASRWLASSPADETSICWIEGRHAEVALGTRPDRAEDTRSRRVSIRVRLGGRTGSAETRSASAGDLERALRGALALARCSDPSPEWDRGAAQGEIEPLPSPAHDAALAELQLDAARQRLETLRGPRLAVSWAWSEEWIVSVGSFHPPRALARTRSWIEARSGGRRRLGTAVASGDALAGLDPAEVAERARAREAESLAEGSGGPSPALVLAPEAVAALLARFSRHALSARGEIARGGPFAPLLSPRLTLRDEPASGGGFALPFDFDGCPKRSRSFVERGRVVTSAWDLDLAARHGRTPTGHGMGADDAWPLHLTMAPGSEDTPALCRRAAGGIWVGELESLVVEEDPELSTRFRLRGARRIDASGAPSAALPDLEWRGSLVSALTNLVGVGSELTRVAGGPSRLESYRVASLALAAGGELAVRPG